MIGELLDLLPIQVGPCVGLLVDVNTDWYREDTDGYANLKGC